MRIDWKPGPDPAAAARVADGPAPGASPRAAEPHDEVMLSRIWQRLDSGREERIAHLRSAAEAGSYRPSAADISRGMVRFYLGNPA